MEDKEGILVRKIKIVAFLFSIMLITTSCVSSLFVAGTKPTYFYQDKYSSTNYIEKSRLFLRISDYDTLCHT